MAIREAAAPTLEVVAILRKCECCKAWKLLEHYLLRPGPQGKALGVKTCAACRGRR